MATKQVFKAQIEEGRGGGAFVVVPPGVHARLGTQSRVAVKVHFDQVSYRGSIAPMDGRHILGIRKSIRKELGKDVGDRVRVTLERDTSERIVDLPDELVEIFRANAALRKTYESLSYTNRREIAEWVASAKRAETRENRARKAIDRILET